MYCTICHASKQLHILQWPLNSDYHYYYRNNNYTYRLKENSIKFQKVRQGTTVTPSKIWTSQQISQLTSWQWNQDHKFKGWSIWHKKDILTCETYTLNELYIGTMQYTQGIIMEKMTTMLLILSCMEPIYEPSLIPIKLSMYDYIW